MVIKVSIMFTTGGKSGSGHGHIDWTGARGGETPWSGFSFLLGVQNNIIISYL